MNKNTREKQIGYRFSEYERRWLRQKALDKNTSVQKLIEAAMQATYPELKEAD